VVSALRRRFGFERVEEAEGIDEHVRFILPEAVLSAP